VLIWARLSPRTGTDTAVSAALAVHTAGKQYVTRIPSSRTLQFFPLTLCASLPCCLQAAPISLTGNRALVPKSKAYYLHGHLSVFGFSDGPYQPLASSILCAEWLVMHFGGGK